VGHFSKIQNLIVNVAKNATLVALYRSFVEFLDPRSKMSESQQINVADKNINL